MAKTQHFTLILKKSSKGRKRTILITGAAGFIGSNVLEYLFNKYKKHKFIVLDALTYAGNLKNFPPEMLGDNRFRFIYGDITNNTMVDKLVSESDVVIHFAAETHVTRSIHDNRKFFETDVLGTQAIANAVYNYKNKIDRFIHISTCEVYGTGQKRRMDEFHPLNPHSPYAAAKTGADRLVHSYYITYKIPTIILRPFNIYGPRQHLEKAIPRFITSAILNEPLPVHGSGKARRDYMHVSDVATAVDLLISVPIKKVEGQVFNIGSGKTTSILTIAKAVARKMKIPESQIRFVQDRPGQVPTFSCNYNKIKKLLGWSPKKDLREGLSETIQWYKDNQDVWNQQTWLRRVPITLPDGKIEFH